VTELDVWLWLMARFRKTGNEAFHKAADALDIPLIDQLQRLSGRRGPTVGKEDRQRLRRMARMVMAGASIRAAARQEVAMHGRGKHNTPEAAVDRLQRQYRERRQDIEALVTEIDRWAADERARHEQVKHCTGAFTTEIDRFAADECARRK
jgi:hypothetical protein